MRKIVLRNVGLAVLLSSSLFANILDTPHGDIVSSSDGSDNGEICVYCHTPHAANNDEAGPVPLWNKPVSKITFQMYGATTGGVAGETIAGTATDAQPSDQSLACLGCHDGVSAMNSVINAPGSGRMNAVDGILIGQSTPAQMPHDQTKAIGSTNAVGFENGNIVYGEYGSLDNDHPLSIPYIAGRASLKDITTPLVNFFGATRIEQLLREGGDGVLKVQCVSCHDPHGTGNPRLLRTANIGSSLCLGCHDK